MLAMLASRFSTPISDLERLPMWEIEELLQLAKEQDRAR